MCFIRSLLDTSSSNAHNTQLVMTRYQDFNFDIISIQYFTKYHNINIDILKAISM